MQNYTNLSLAQRNADQIWRGGRGGMLISCMTVFLRLHIIAPLHRRDGESRSFTGRGSRIMRVADRSNKRQGLKGAGEATSTRAVL